MAKKYKQVAVRHAEDVISGKVLAGKERILAAARFLSDLKRDDLELRTKEADFLIGIVEKIMVHRQGESIDGTPLKNTPLILQPWQIFVIYNIIGFYKKGTNERRYKEAFIYVPRKNGKAVSLDTEIPTPDGWKRMEDIHEGDLVYGQDGKPSRVLAESEIFRKKMYLVRFEDGAEVKASADHIWTVQTKDSRRTSRRQTKRRPNKPELRSSGGWFETTTEEMSANFTRVRADGKGMEYTYRVPMAHPVQYTEKDLPLDPYTLGVWLGDGTSTDTTISCGAEDREEMVRLLTEAGHRCTIRDSGKLICLDITRRGEKNATRDALREIGVWGNKNIPDMYKQGSVGQRLELLQGLMDTDGTCSKAGQCEFVQKSERLARDIVELISSLGLKATIKAKNAKCNGKDAGKVFRIQFWTDKTMPCFKMQRKRNRLKEHMAPRMHAKSIVEIVPIETEPSKCITIDNESHLYLVGRHYTATHNSMFIAALAFGLALMERRSGSKIYIVAASMKQALESFEDIRYTLQYKEMIEDFRVRDNNAEHSIKHEFLDDEGRPEGSLDIEALASNPKLHDSLNSNIQIIDELHAVSGSEYNRFKESGKAYTNKLCIGITTAGDDENSFCFRRLQYAEKVMDGLVEDDTFFAYISRADKDDNGDVDYTNPEQHEKANPSYGVTIRPEDLQQEALQAMNDPQQRKDFLSRSLNIYTSAMKAWFDIEEFRRSDGKYNWSLGELAKLPIDWYGGADLSRMYDLTAAALYGEYQGVDIIITHAFFPVVMAARKADEDGIPLFGWQEDGWLTMCNSPTVNVTDVVNWFLEMKRKGFKIKLVGHDRKFAGEEYFPAMTAAGFRIVDQPQYYYLKSQGFRHIEKAAKDGKIYYLHSDAYEYCVSNVRAIEKTDDAVQYEKIKPEQRIDLFDASVFACIQKLNDYKRQKKAAAWWS